ncbi:MAG TPA: glutathione S-transferase family protein [Rhodobacteraceae bacterium]|nr:glutathione S-transferase family protein [Paracoccaceae bacterium]
MIRLHHCAQTRSMRVLWMLYELGLDFELVGHSFDRSLRDPAYLALHPVGRVPALEIDGGVIFESLAALQYLAERHVEKGLAGAGMDWLNWLNFAETISQHTAALTQQHIAIYPPEARSGLVCKIEAMRLAKTYQALEGRLEGRAFVLGEFSAADVGLGQALYMARHFVKFEGFPRVAAYYERLSARVAFKKALPQADEALLYVKDDYEVPDG